MARRETLEVDMSWLEPEELARTRGSTRPPPKRPSKADTAAVRTRSSKPPAPKTPSRPPGAKRSTSSAQAVRRETMDVKLEWLEPEQPTAAPTKRPRKPWEPPTLPPPPANATKPRRAVPPPLPREEPEDPPKKPGKR